MTSMDGFSAGERRLSKLVLLRNILLIFKSGKYAKHLRNLKYTSLAIQMMTKIHLGDLLPKAVVKFAKTPCQLLILSLHAKQI